MIGEEGANVTERGDFETKIHDLTSTDDTFCSNQQLNNQTVIDMNLQTQRKQVTKNQGNVTMNGNNNTGNTRSMAEINRTWFLRVSSAVFYAVASFMIMVINKRILTVYKFPSFQVLGIGQMLSTIVILWLSRHFGIVKFTSFSPMIVKKIFPLPLFYVGNMIFGLGGTQALSLPMMTVLRRFSVLMTMILEYLILNVRPRFEIQLSVFTMIFGAIVAALNDLAFNLPGYTYILLNDVCTAGNGVVTKKKLDAKDLGKYGLLFYNSLLMLPVTVIIAYGTGDLWKAYEYQGWFVTTSIKHTDTHTDIKNEASTMITENPSEDIYEGINYFFLFHFLLSCVFGFILMFATLLCTQYNSALTTTIIGCLKNILITYSGMFIGGDYVFSWWNFIGLNISAIATIMYTKITFGRNSKSSPAKSNTDSKHIEKSSVKERETTIRKEVIGLSVRNNRKDPEQSLPLISNSNNA